MEQILHNGLFFSAFQVHEKQGDDLEQPVWVCQGQIEPALACLPSPGELAWMREEQ